MEIYQESYPVTLQKCLSRFLASVCVGLFALFVIGCVPEPAFPATPNRASEKRAGDLDEFEGILFESSCDQIRCFGEDELPEPAYLLSESDSSASGLDFKDCYFACVFVDGEYKSVIRYWRRGSATGEVCWHLNVESVDHELSPGACAARQRE